MQSFGIAVSRGYDNACVARTRWMVSHREWGELTEMIPTPKVKKTKHYLCQLQLLPLCKQKSGCNKIFLPLSLKNKSQARKQQQRNNKLGSLNNDVQTTTSFTQKNGKATRPNRNSMGFCARKHPYTRLHKPLKEPEAQAAENSCEQEATTARHNAIFYTEKCV